MMKTVLGFAAITMLSLAFFATSQDSLSMTDAENVWGAGSNCTSATSGDDGCVNEPCRKRAGVKPKDGDGLKIITTQCRYLNDEGHQVNCGAIKVAVGCPGVVEPGGPVGNPGYGGTIN